MAKKSQKKTSKQLKYNKLNDNFQNKNNDPWSFVWYVLKSLPWWVIKFIDWIYTLITATIVYLLT
jgi:hypothetical protein